MDAVGETEAGGVALGNFQGGFGDVGGVDGGGRKFFGQGDGNAAGAGADVNDGEVLALEARRAAGAEFADGEAIESHFDEVLGFGAGDQDVGIHFEFEAPKFLFAGEVLRGFAERATAQEREIFFGAFGGENFFGVGIEPGTVVSGDMEQEKFGGESERGNGGGAKLLDALAEQ